MSEEKDSPKEKEPKPKDGVILPGSPEQAEPEAEAEQGGVILPGKADPPSGGGE